MNLDFENDDVKHKVLHFIFCDFDSFPKKNIEKIEALLEAGADPNYYNNEGYTPLQYAVKFKQIEAVKY